MVQAGSQKYENDVFKFLLSSYLGCNQNWLEIFLWMITTLTITQNYPPKPKKNFAHQQTYLRKKNSLISSTHHSQCTFITSQFVTDNTFLIYNLLLCLVYYDLLFD